MNIKKNLIIILFATFFSCSNNTNQPTHQGTSGSALTYRVKPLQRYSEDDLDSSGTDLRISIVEKSENDSTQFFKAISTYKGKDVGLLVSVPKSKEGNKGFGEGIILESIGMPSNNFLQALSEIYNKHIDTSAKFVKKIKLNFVNLKEIAKSLTGEAGQPYTTANEYKLFFEGKKDEDYAEIFLNINPKENWIEFAEKDEEYRPILLHFLSQ